jgi:hypothetical protein
LFYGRIGLQIEELFYFSTKGPNMKRRDFLKSTMLLAAVTSVVSKAGGLFNEAMAAAGFATAGKLGYKDVSPQAANNKTCLTCKHYKANAAAGKDAGECTLKAMQNATKLNPVWVKDAAYCNMWAKKA